MVALVVAWYFTITFWTGGVQVLRFDAEADCNASRTYMLLGLEQQAPLRDPRETVTVTPCAFGEPPG